MADGCLFANKKADIVRSFRHNTDFLIYLYNVWSTNYCMNRYNSHFLSLTCSFDLPHSSSQNIGKKVHLQILTNAFLYTFHLLLD